MSETYKEAMNHIVVTEEMKLRILENIQHVNWEKKNVASFVWPKRYMAVAACLTVLIIGAVSLTTLNIPNQPENPSGMQSGVLNMTNASSADELSQLVGFEVQDLKDVPFDITEIQYTSYGGELAEIKYIGETQNLVFRKAAGNIDPSGDFASYSDTVTLDFDSISVTLKGESGAYALAIWQDGSYSYSMKSSVPLTKTEWTSVLEAEV